MWPRYFEVLLGGWLVASPWIFGHADGSFLQWTDIAAGVATIVLALSSFMRATRWAHLAIGVVAVVLGASAYFGVERPGPPFAQNQITVAILLLTFFLLPNEASRPPEPWRR